MAIQKKPATQGDRTTFAVLPKAG